MARALALAVSIGVLALAVALAVRFQPGGEQYQFVEAHEWIPAFGVGYTLGLDGIATALVLLTAVLLPLLILAGCATSAPGPRGAAVVADARLAAQASAFESFMRNARGIEPGFSGPAAVRDGLIVGAGYEP